jgi:hypothetical protein
MESLRALVGMKPKDTASDEQVFVEELFHLLEPHVHAAVLAQGQEEINTGIALDREEELSDIQLRLLQSFFMFAKTDPGLSKFMFPIMMYLRKARADRQKVKAKE